MAQLIITHNLIIVDTVMGYTTITVYSYKSYKEAVKEFIKFLSDMKKNGKAEYDDSELKSIVEQGKYELDEDNSIHIVKSEPQSINY